MDSTKKTTQKTSGTRKRYKAGQLVTINHRVFRITKNMCAWMSVFVVLTEIMKNMISVWNYQ